MIFEKTQQKKTMRSFHTLDEALGQKKNFLCNIETTANWKPSKISVSIFGLGKIDLMKYLNVDSFYHNNKRNPFCTSFMRTKN